MNKRNLTLVSILFISMTASANIVINDHFTLSLPATEKTINTAINAGLDITLAGTKVDPNTGVVYGMLNHTNADKFCTFENKMNMTESFHGEAYITLLSRGENVKDYGWPFSELNVLERLASYTDSSGDMVTGLKTTPRPQPGLVVCRNKFSE